MNPQNPTWDQNLGDKRDASSASKLQHRRFDVLRRKPIRRSLVIVSFLLLTGAVFLVWTGASTAAAFGPQALYLSAGLLFVVSIMLLHVTMRAYWSDRKLDERLIAVRNAAHRISYRIVIVVTGLALLTLSVFWQAPWATFEMDPHHLRSLLLAFIGLAAFMPDAVLAWREREV